MFKLQNILLLVALFHVFPYANAIQTVSTFSPTLERSSASNIYGSENYRETIAQRIRNVQLATENYTDVSIYMLQPNLSNGFFELVVVDPSANEQLRTNLFQDVSATMTINNIDDLCEILIIFVEDILEFSRPLRVRLIQVK